jgi:hypothetical protein
MLPLLTFFTVAYSKLSAVTFVSTSTHTFPFLSSIPKNYNLVITTTSTSLRFIFFLQKIHVVSFNFASKYFVILGQLFKYDISYYVVKYLQCRLVANVYLLETFLTEIESSNNFIIDNHLEYAKLAIENLEFLNGLKSF